MFQFVAVKPEPGTTSRPATPAVSVAKPAAPLAQPPQTVPSVEVKPEGVVKQEEDVKPSPEYLNRRNMRCEYGRPFYHINDTLIACVGSLINTDNANDYLLSSYLPLTRHDYDLFARMTGYFGAFGYMRDKTTAVSFIAGPLPEAGAEHTVSFKGIIAETDGVYGIADADNLKTKLLISMIGGIGIESVDKDIAYLVMPSTWAVVSKKADIDTLIKKLGKKKMDPNANAWFNYAYSWKLLENEPTSMHVMYVYTGLWYNFREHAAVLKKSYEARKNIDALDSFDYEGTMRAFSNNAYEAYAKTLNKYLVRATVHEDVLNKLASDYAELPREESYKALYCYLRRRAMLFVYTLKSEPHLFDVEMIYPYYIGAIEGGWFIVGSVTRGAAKKAATRDNTSSFVELTLKKTGDRYTIDYTYAERKSYGERVRRTEESFERWDLYLRKTGKNILETYSGLKEQHAKMKSDGRLGPGALNKLTVVPPSMTTKRNTDGTVRPLEVAEAQRAAMTKSRATSTVVKSEAKKPKTIDIEEVVPIEVPIRLTTEKEEKPRSTSSSSIVLDDETLDLLSQFVPRVK